MHLSENEYNSCANTDRLNQFLHSYSRNSFLRIIRSINVRLKREKKKEREKRREEGKHNGTCRLYPVPDCARQLFPTHCFVVLVCARQRLRDDRRTSTQVQ